MEEISVDRIGEISAVRMPRRVDVTNTQAFVEAVRGQMADNRRTIVLDFSSTESIDSTALGATVQLFKSLRGQHGDLRLASVSDGVRRVFAITRLDRVFDIFETLDEAVNAGRRAP